MGTEEQKRPADPPAPAGPPIAPDQKPFATA